MLFQYLLYYIQASDYFSDFLLSTIFLSLEQLEVHYLREHTHWITGKQNERSLSSPSSEKLRYAFKASQQRF